MECQPSSRIMDAMVLLVSSRWGVGLPQGQVVGVVVDQPVQVVEKWFEKYQPPQGVGVVEAQNPQVQGVEQEQLLLEEGEVVVK